MLNEQIEALRIKLNKMLEADCIYNEEILEVSQELDILINQFMIENKRNPVR